MQSGSIMKLRWFFPWQDDVEEAWLTESSRRGLHLAGFGLPGVYLFQRGTPRETVYRLDYRSRLKDRQGYLQLFQDAGWEHVGKMGGWEYFRKEPVPGKVEEIFTDAESKIAMLRRVLGEQLVFVGIMAILLGGTAARTPEGPWVWIEASAVALLVLMGIGAAVEVRGRIGRLRSSARG
jgi:hypothetical protein